jgi:hypothetical protein
VRIGEPLTGNARSHGNTADVERQVRTQLTAGGVK